MNAIYEVSANDTTMGIYVAKDAQEARDLAAADAGYEDEENMVYRLEQPSALWARVLDDSASIMEAMDRAEIDGDQDWNAESTTYSVTGGTVRVTGSSFEILR
jgi:hypothetical protein